MRGWVPGTLYRYEVLSEQKVSFRQKTEGAAAPSGMLFRIQGEWDIGVTVIEGDSIHARVQLRSPSFHLNVEGQGELAPEVQRSMTAALGSPFFLTFDRTGAVKLTHFERQTDVLVRGLLRALVASTQFVAPGLPGNTWQAQEHDSTGQYLAVYQRQAAARFEKRKQRYSHLTTPQGLQPLGLDIRVDVDSRITFELAEDLWPQSLQGSERLNVDAGESMPAAAHEHTVRLRLLKRFMEPSLLGAFAARQGAMDSSPLSSFQGLEPDPMTHYRQVLAGRRFEDMVKDLRALPKEERARDDARTLALEQLRALFMLEPAEALKVPELLRSGMEPLAASPMLGALSAASTPEAIRALVEIANDGSLPTDIAMDTVSALGMAGRPTHEGVDALRKLTHVNKEAIRDTATLAFGNAAFQLRDEDERGAAALVHELERNYRVANSPEQQALVLRALGNTRSPSMLATLEEALRSSSPLVREAAVVALRNVSEPAADALLAATLAGEPSSEVRRAAVFACSFRPLVPLLPALGQALRMDPVNGVRSDVVRLLGAHLREVPEIVPVLLWVSQNDSDPEIRHMASVFLNT